MASSLETAPTLYVDAANATFAYREVGKPVGVPLVLLQHFSGTMDGWDPAVVNGLAETRLVIAFNNRGVGSSTGQTPDNVEAMADDARTFIEAIDYARVDLLGFSLGGFVAQLLAARQPRLVRKVVLAGTAPPGGEEHLLAALDEARSRKNVPDPRLPLFFTPSQASQTAGRAFLKRAAARQTDRDPESGESVTGPQAKALITWCATKDPNDEVLGAINQPALVVSGSSDTMLPDTNAYFMFKRLRSAQLMLYPDAGHGAIFQYPDMFVHHAAQFLDA